MELLNATRMPAGYTLGMDPDGRESVILAVKGTFEIPDTAHVEPHLAAKQVPLVLADEFTGEPGFSATVYECDYAPMKPRCDVLLNGRAYVPGAKQSRDVTVSLRIGTVDKSFKVIGNRVWLRGLSGPKPSNPEPFSVLPISYDNAFGGIDDSHDDWSKHAAYRPNLVGIGFHANHAAEAINGKPLPNTEELGQPVRCPNGEYRPMAFGAVTRASEPRISFGGTYDEDWADNRFPFLPADFDPRYFQAAPLDQQIPYPQGGENVVLINLTPRGRTAFRLPTVHLPIEFTTAGNDHTETRAVLDTILIEPDFARFILTWRATHPLRRNMMEMRRCIIGRMPRGWYRARDRGKTYYPSLGALVAARRDVAGTNR